MPDLGHEVKDFKVFTWRLTNWRKLDKKLTSPEFECGGHRWYVHCVLCIIVLSFFFHKGEYCYSLSEIPMRHRTTRSPSISTTQIPNALRKDGMPALNSLLLFPIPMTQRSILFLVRVVNCSLSFCFALDFLKIGSKGETDPPLCLLFKQIRMAHHISR